LTGETIPPTFADIFGESWSSMPCVFHKHYANRPYSTDVTKTVGLMKIEMSRTLRLLAPLFGLTKTLVPFTGEDIRCEVNFESEINSRAFWFNRVFHFPNRKPYVFRSKLVPIGENRVIEYTKSGIGWVATYEFAKEQVRLHHIGYVISILGQDFKLPLEWVFGKSTAFEEAVDENSFGMKMEIRHPVFGKIYGYEGRFSVIELPNG